MRKDLLIKTRSLGGVSDLTLLAPIRPGLVPALESLSYKTRIKRLLQALNAGRSSSHEYSLLRSFSDAIERVGKIHSVRVAIVEPDQVLLSVTFDASWESYLRVLWQKVGPLLDVIFCNTIDYPLAWSSHFDDWAAWVQRVQIESDFFYGMPGLSVDDVQSLRNEELLHRQAPGGEAGDLAATRSRAQTAEALTWARVGPAAPHVLKEVGRQGLKALSLLYRLSALYLPGTADGDNDVLHRAARDLLSEFLSLHQRRELDDVVTAGRKRFDEPLSWLLRPVPPRGVPALPDSDPRLALQRQDVQGGIVSPYPDTLKQGRLLLLAFRDTAAAGRFVTAHWRQLSTELAPCPEGHSFNLALTPEGLRLLGLAEHQLDRFPQEFREGMEARASVLGDVRANHPRRWRLPLRQQVPIELAAVHAVVQIRFATSPPPLLAQLLADPDLLVLAEQAMARNVDPKKGYREHFGYADGSSQPEFDPALRGAVYPDSQVQLGEVLLGHPNAAELPRRADPQDLEASTHEQLLKNGSFLVVRKLRQDVPALREVVEAAVRSTGLSRPLIYAKLMGRYRNGTPLMPVGEDRPNDFDYADEQPPGSRCPIHAHVRRANPRLADDPELAPAPGARTPRLMRRGMSYGPAFDAERPETAEAERGLVFMAYNASIAEQFEVIQRWLTGGNSAGGYSGQSDPLLGVPPTGEVRQFRFEHEGRVHRIALDGDADPLGDTRPFVRLEWGMYLFTPSISALKLLAALARKHPAARARGAWSVHQGRLRIQALVELERREGAVAARQAWKAALEDPEAQRNFDSASIWAAIRAVCHGVLRTPYGVIVASRELVDQVLKNEQGLYSVNGYRARMLGSIGEIYLGLDDSGAAGCPYREQSTSINDAIARLPRDGSFTAARTATRQALEAMVADEARISYAFGEPRWELNLDVKEVLDQALARLCEQWCGLRPEAMGAQIRPGGARWDWRPGQPTFYPGHFTAPSRYIFQPQPGAEVDAFGQAYGQALRDSYRTLVRRHRDGLAAGQPPLFAPAPLSDTILHQFAREPRCPHADEAMDDQAARALVGVLMGFLPTVDGNLRLVLNEWLRDGNFWTLRARLAGAPPEAAQAMALLEPALKRAMLLRPSPELVWRTSTRRHRIGDETVEAEERVVVAQVSAAHQGLEEDREDDVHPIFGGNRRAAGAPTHACPGYEAAMGVLMGICCALLEFGNEMRPSGVPLSLTLEGPLQQAPQPAAPTRSGPPRTPVDPLPGPRLRLLADGDSWVSYGRYGVGGALQNLAASLAARHGHDVVPLGIKGSRLFDFFSDDREHRADDLAYAQSAPARSFRLERLCAKVRALTARGRPPQAIVLSLGGNDVADKRLEKLLDAQGLDAAAVDRKVDGLMRAWLEAVLLRLATDCRVGGRPIPVVLHGYDFPVPDARWIAGVPVPPGAWLFTSFSNKGLLQDAYPSYPERGVALMRTLIERLNAMQKQVTRDRRFAHVHAVNLCGILSPAREKYLADWDNELHPSAAGFDRLALALDRQLRLVVS